MSKSIKTAALFRYFFPELIIAAVLYIALDLINFRFIACIDTTLCNSTLYVTNLLFHLITKIVEGFSVGLVIMCGQYNGSKHYKKAGEVLANVFWVSALVGAIVSLLLYFGAHTIYAFYQVPQEIATLGVPYLQIRTVGVFFSFMYFAIVGFLRGIKNPKLPMVFFLLGAVVYLFFDYALIFGAWGFPAMGLNGSALATVIQCGTMLLASLLYLVLHKDIHKYRINLFSRINVSHIRALFTVSWPVMIDKSCAAFIPIWLSKMIGCTAVLCTATDSAMMYNGLTVLKTMEKVGLLPAFAFAQVITYLVSNDYKNLSFRYIKNNIKKVLLFSCVLVGLGTLVFCLKPYFFLSILNKQSAYSDFIAYTLPFVAFLVLFDVIQVILSGALRGASDVKTVMVARVLGTFFFFMPLSYGIMLLPIENLLLKFILLYSSTHISFGMMSIVYIYRFK